MRNRFATMGLLACFAAGPAAAQDIPRTAQLAIEISGAQRANERAMKNFSWKRRIEMQVKGETKAVKMHLVRFNLEGKPESTPIGGDEEKQKHGLRGRKQKQAREWVEEVAEIVLAYTHPSTGTMVDYFGKAEFMKGSGQMQGTLRINGAGIIRPEDTYTLWVDSETRIPRKLEFRTKLEKDQLIGIVYYRTLDSGEFYPGRTIVRVPEQDRRVIVETFDYTRQQ